MRLKDQTYVRYLAELSFDDDELFLKEIGTHLRRSFSDVARISPRRFEMLVGDLFRNLGYDVQVTQQTRDGGCDLVLVESSTGQKALVECKRWLGNKINVGVVRQLAGVQLEKGVDRAKIVATTLFTGPASDFAANLSHGQSGYEIDLIDAQRLAEMLGIYNETLPPLSVVLKKRGDDSDCLQQLQELRDGE